MAVVDTVVTRLSLGMSRVGGVILLLAAVLISLEIAARKVLSLPFNVGTELATYALAVGASWSFAQALLQRAHVRIDVVRRVLPPQGRAALDLFALAALMVFGLILSIYVGTLVQTSWDLGARANTPLATPLVLPQALWWWGIVWFTGVAALEMVRAVAALVRGEMAKFHRIAAPLGTEDEAGAAVEQAGFRTSEGV